MRGLWAGALALAAIGLIVAGALAALLAEAPTLEFAGLWRDAYLRRVVWFTFWQAALSTFLSVGLALPVARALARRHFAGREWLIKLFGLPLVIPTIVAVFAIVAVYGQSGLVNRAAAALGLPTWTHFYGLSGILLAHTFFNLPLAVRLLLPLWRAIPGETWRLASQLGMSGGALWRSLEWPLLRQALPGVAGLVFMLCFTSFAVVLALGGGPAATTIEVAIYQALKFDFDLGRAVLLALLQLTLCALLVGFSQRFAQPMASAAAPGRRQERPDLRGWPGRMGDAIAIASAALAVLLPLATLVVAGLSGPVLATLADSLLWYSALRSLFIALGAGVLALLLGWALALASRELRVRRYRPRWADAVELGGALILVVPPLVLGTGFFVLLAPRADVFWLAPLLVVIVNALMGLPYVIRILTPALNRVAEHHDRLCASLGLAGWNRLLWVEWPLARRPLGLALALAAALSTGYLGVIALFGSQDNATLPLLLYQRLASYQMGQAAVTALALTLLCLALFTILERGVGGRHVA
ncbi:MAG: thiamine/thiamine pyrophosphate ABC transporter permease [Gammaproteobacteria bacterium]